MTSKLQQLVEAAQASEKDNGPWPFKPTLVVSTTTLLELCELLNQAEEALKAQVEDKRDGPFFHEDEHPKGSCLRNSEEALTAIKQWKGE